jgi:hypothetical protein
MNNFDNKLNNFINQNPANNQVGEEVCDAVTGKCYIRTQDGLIERTVIEKKLVVEDGRELLREDMPISHTRRTYIR